MLADRTTNLGPNGEPVFEAVPKQVLTELRQG